MSWLTWVQPCRILLAQKPKKPPHHRPWLRKTFSLSNVSDTSIICSAMNENKPWHCRHQAVRPVHPLLVSAMQLLGHRGHADRTPASCLDQHLLYNLYQHLDLCPCTHTHLTIGRVSYIRIYLCYFCFRWKTVSLVQASLQYLMHRLVFNNLKLPYKTIV